MSAFIGARMDEQYASARLIAAAPDLLEAAQDMAKWVDLRYLNDAEKARYDRHVAAIQKATGGAS